MPFKVKGNSKYRLVLDNNLVKKSSINDDNRLVISAQKQKEFKSEYFKTPKIHEITKSSFTMDYINGDSFIDFFIRASKRDLDGLIEKIEGYFKERIIGQCKIPISVITEKLETIPESFDLLNYIKSLDYINLKVGKCHGDLTFSNMIFTENIYLIDFLETFLESPTIDMVKLRQDTHLYWSLNMVNNVRDVIKVKLGLKYIDDWLTSTYNIEHYNLLQAVNLYRIYPYTDDPKIKEYLRHNINYLCEHL